MPPSSTAPFSGIFVSYRRDDSSGHAGRLFDRLGAHFGKKVFMDIDHIEPGEKFVQVIENYVGSCEILIAVIGRQWLSSSDGSSRRLDNPKDYVRLEIVAALNRDVRVIPVLVQGATMPRPLDLPDDLEELSTRHAVELSDSRWNRDVDQLIASMDRILVQRDEARRLAEQEDQEHNRREAEGLFQESLRLAEAAEIERQQQQAERRRLEETREREAEEASRSELKRQKREVEEKEVRRLSEEALPGVRSVEVGPGRADPPGRRRALIIAAGASLVVVAALGVWLQFGRQLTGQGSTPAANVNSSPGAAESPAPPATQPTKTESPDASQKDGASTNAVNTTKSVATPLSNRSRRTTQRKQDNGEAQRQKCALAALENRPCPP